MGFGRRTNKTACTFKKNSSNETTKRHFVSHLLSIYSHHQGTEWGCNLLCNSSQYLWPPLQKPTTHCIIIKVPYRLQTVWRWQLQASGSFDSQPQCFHPCNLNFIKIPNISVTYLHIYIIPPLHLMFVVSKYSYCCWRSNFTNVYSCVQSLVMVSYTVTALWLESVYVSAKYQSFHKTVHFHTSTRNSDTISDTVVIEEGFSAHLRVS